MKKTIIIFFLVATAVLNATSPTYKNVTKLYVATFDRAPSAAGLRYWVDDSNLDLEGIAKSFFDQDETKRKYPSDASIGDFISAVYINLFDRFPDDEGYRYWYNEISSGRIDQSAFILATINGSGGDDALVLAQKTDAAFDEISGKLAPSQLDLPGYSLPTNKQGLSDRNYALLGDARYEVFENKLEFGIQKYNYYWYQAEDLSPSTPSPQACANGYTLFPEDENQKKLLGIHSYHCYKESFIKSKEKRFEQNTNHHMQVAVVLWTTPEFYRDPGCEGFCFPLQEKHLMEGCYPTASHYDDYEDWIRFTAYRFGKYIDHYIVWNEVDSTNWADSSTTRYTKEVMSKDIKFHMNRSFDIYANLLKRTINSVNSIDKTCLDYSGKCKNLVYVPIDRGWYSQDPIVNRYEDQDRSLRIRWQNMNLLDYIWERLGLKYTWSIAVHPYGRVYEDSSNSLRFSTLKDLSAYQKEQIDIRKSKHRSWLSYPQSRLFASEQNVNDPNNYEAKAKFICESYDVSMQMPEIIAISHNHFQDYTKRDDDGSSYHHMLPSTVREDLSNADKYSTFRAYMSTATSVWNRDDDHYCCDNYGLGCKLSW
ncbi:MAG: DUF4214 domain-containing protein [Campylobacterota bacterium]|nr:DUF4214 domain-containing protein [Campylobacterota bacterium]